MTGVENEWIKLETELYAIPLEDLCHLALSHFDISISETGVWSIIPPIKGSISAEAEFTIDTWSRRER